MRLLVACSECQRQYDATGKRIGSRFRCHCGEVLSVQPPKGHDASVVRCSTCGAPREEESTGCNFCEADFTLHERDLHTVCPKCLSRISDRARFCHHCGTKLTPEEVAAAETPLACPVCGDPHHLSNRQMGKVAVMECGRCVGLWMGNEAFGQVAEQASAEVSQAAKTGDHFRKPQKPAKGRLPGQKGVRYRNCVICGAMMHRRNYGRRSGVIIDVCRDHGVWFDAEELPRIVGWIRSGGLAQANRRRDRKAAQKKRVEKRLASRSVRQPGRTPVLGDTDGAGGPFDLAYVLSEFVGTFFRR